MSAPPIYLDHHATTPCDPRVVEAMLPFFSTTFGNPASLTHEHGRRASNAVEDARIGIARFFRVQPNEIYFTAGATESNNIALNSLTASDHLITSAIEHKSVLAPAKRLEKRGVELTILQPDREGFLDPAKLRAAIRPNTKLVSIEAANGEIGTIQPIGEFAAICRERGVLYHSDITQAAGKIDVNLAEVDLASWSAHKIYGPKGIGGLYVRRSVRVEPLILGGGQEKGVRSGTVNAPGVIGMATAFRIRKDEMAEEGERLTALRNELWDRLTAEIAGASVNGPRELRLPGNLNVSFDRIEAESLIVAMRRFSLSSGSACSSGERGPSPVLMAIGVAEPSAIGSIRFGLGKSNTAEHMGMLVDDLKRVVARLREISAA
ncbi:MAG TPA: cysteine desulfurase family protein [Thermoanaerobaculia bacterium]|nr:cysteine desulfurase family protein [Thermoanaerobaculia bacterium]